MVFQDGQTHVNPQGEFRVTSVFDVRSSRKP